MPKEQKCCDICKSGPLACYKIHKNICPCYTSPEPITMTGINILKQQADNSPKQEEKWDMEKHK
jgi:hypothetical protein